MSYETGTATNQADLWAKLLAFLTTECGWESLAGITPAADGFDVLYLKGPGSSVDNEIFVNLTKYFDVGNDIWGFGFRGARGFNDEAHYNGQPFTSAEVCLVMWNSPMTYWFFGNGRRFIIVLKVATTYHAGYFGWGLPFGTPVQYPYPLAIMGNTSSRATRFNNEGEGFRNFFDPSTQTAYFNSPGNGWNQIANYSSAGAVLSGNNVAPWGQNAVLNIIHAPDGTKPVIQSFIHGSLEGGSHFMFLEDVSWIPGFGGVGPEDEFTIGADDYLVFNNIFRLQNQDFVAIKIVPNEE